MVSKVNLSRYNEGEPPEEGADRRIAGGPIYSTKELLEILSGGGGVVKPAGNCVKQLQALSFDEDDAAELLVRGLTQGRYKNSEWAGCGGNSVAACDVYIARRLEDVGSSHGPAEVEYYLKFAIGRTGKVIVLVRCHV